MLIYGMLIQEHLHESPSRQSDSRPAKHSAEMKTFNCTWYFFQQDAAAADGCEISFEHLLCYYLDPYADLFGESMALPQVLLPCIGRAQSAPC